MGKKVKFSVGEFYHIYNHGRDKQDIFLCPDDYRRFLLCLNHANSIHCFRSQNICLGTKGFSRVTSQETLVDIIVYCLMPDHFHILIREKLAGGISKFMAKVSSAHTMYFNVKHNQKGSLFAGAFSVKHIVGEAYIKSVIAHIHLNPLKIF